MCAQAKWERKKNVFCIVIGSGEKSNTVKTHECTNSIFPCHATRDVIMAPNRYLCAGNCDRNKFQYFHEWRSCRELQLWLLENLLATFTIFLIFLLPNDVSTDSTGMCACMCLTRSTDYMRLDIWFDFAMGEWFMYGWKSERLNEDRDMSECIEATANRMREKIYGFSWKLSVFAVIWNYIGARLSPQQQYRFENICQRLGFRQTY